MKSVKTKPNYNKLLAAIGLAIETARQNAIKAVNTELVKANWEIGRHIVEFEQQGNERAEKCLAGKTFKRSEIAVWQRIWQAQYS